MGYGGHGHFTTKSSGISVALPLFIPVFRPDFYFELSSGESLGRGLEAIMVNSFLLYRERGLKEAFEKGYSLREHVGGFHGMLCTDSGAFQQLGGRKVDIDPVEIVRFQNLIKTDVAAPLDLITPPQTSFDDTYQRMVISQHRIEEAVEVSDYSDLAGIQQGGGFFSLRQKHIRQLAELKLNYYGIGSMVPFFNRNHDLSFACRVIDDARAVIGPEPPMHVYGAGDPLDIAFMYFAGANVFDSSSFAHYAKQGYYMTPYGSINKKAAALQLGYDCPCPVCANNDLSVILAAQTGEILRKRHNLYTILATVSTLKEYSGNNRVYEYVSGIYDKHVGNPDLFPGSVLARSWEEYQKGGGREPSAKHGPIVPTQLLENEGSGNAGSDCDLTDLEKETIEALANESAGEYKMGYGQIMNLVTDELLLPKNSGIRAAINGVATLRDVRRLGEYKAFRKNVRGSIYQRLRRYKFSHGRIFELQARLVESGATHTPSIIESLLEEHVGTRERLRHRDAFIEDLRRAIAPGSIVIDIGCGFNPLLFPAEFFENLTCYIAVDKDTEASETVRVFARKLNIRNLMAYTWDISSGATALNKMTGFDHYDFAVLLKTVSVINRADRTRNDDCRAMPVLGDFPASKILATVNRESMTKYRSIEKREAATLRQFIQTYGFSIESEFSCGSEFGYFLSKEQPSIIPSAGIRP